MKHLVLFRHAKTEPWNPEGDFQRSLTERGLKQAPDMARLLKKSGFEPDLLLSSPAVRARQTAQLVAEAMHAEKNRIQFDDALYLASSEQLFNAIRKLDKKYKKVLVVGHNPGLTDLVNTLADKVRIDDLPTAGYAHLCFDVPDWTQMESGTGKLHAFEYPSASLK